jgi:hypothetical protein
LTRFETTYCNRPGRCRLPVGDLDPFATHELRARVLAAWAASPARFREDANAEEDLVRGAYRDRAVIELAQNAADAAARAGVPGHLLLRLTDGVLTAANTGAPLDAEGVESLSTLRASAKRDKADSAGRFGVGFAAVLAVSDEPAIASRTGAIRWSRRLAHELAAGVPTLAEELRRRGDAAPVLRLPLPAEVDLEPGYDTVVRIPVRDSAAAKAVRTQLEELDDALLLSLPALTEVVIELGDSSRTLTAQAEGADLVVTLTKAGADRVSRWRRLQRSGGLSADLLADRPTEERNRPSWSVLVAVPVDSAGTPIAPPESVPRVLHAPTPSEEPVSLPALLVASVPLDPTRRHTAPGRLRDYVLARLAEAYVDLLVALPPVPALLNLLPPPLAEGPVDAELGRLILDTVKARPVLPSADGSARLRPPDAVFVPGLERANDPTAIGAVVAGLVHPSWWRHDVLRRLGVTELPLTDVVDALGGLTLTPARWRHLYAALDGADRESLAALPVPLADGRLVRGPRGTLVPEGPAGWEHVTRLGVRVVHPEAAHPLLIKLGAEPATPAAVLRHPSTRAAVEHGDEVTDAILPLVAASAVSVVDEPWLAELRLTDVSGRPRQAGSLFLPHSKVLAWLDPAEARVVASELVTQWGAAVLARVGVRDELGLVREAEVALDGEVWHDVDDEDGWVDAVLAGIPDDKVPPVVAEFVAVRELDLVRDDAWPAVLQWLAQPPYRDAILTPATLRRGDGSHVSVPSYPRWWLTTYARIGGRPLTDYRNVDADPVVAALWEPLPVPLDVVLAQALGVRASVRELLSESGGADDLLGRLADESRHVPASVLRRAYDALADVDPEDVLPPARVRVPNGAASDVVDAADVVVADAPYWAQLPNVHLVPAAPERAEALADVLDVPLAAERYAVEMADRGGPASVPASVTAILPDAPATYIEHDDLRVAGSPVTWWVVDSVIHACTVDGLARGLAWVCGRWSDRLLIAEALREPSAVPMLLIEDAF